MTINSRWIQSKMTATNPNKANKREANWPQVLYFIHIHVLCMYGLWLAFTDAKILTNIFCKLQFSFFFFMKQCFFLPRYFFAVYDQPVYNNWSSDFSNPLVIDLKAINI